MQEMHSTMHSDVALSNSFRKGTAQEPTLTVGSWSRFLPELKPRIA